MNKWPGEVTRKEAIKILVKATDKDVPYWGYLADDFYDELTDSMPTLDNVLLTVEISIKEIRITEVL